MLPSDFQGRSRRTSRPCWTAEPDVFAHNLETVRRLHGRIRPAFGYDRSLEVLRIAKRRATGTGHEVEPDPGDGRDDPRRCDRAMRDLATRACEIVTMGQYLQPTTMHLPVDRWVSPEEFAEHKRMGEAMGIAHVEAGPLVRSSYHAGTQLRRASSRAWLPPGERKVEEPACKPDPVRGSTTAGDHLSRRTVASPAAGAPFTGAGAAYPAARAGRPRTLPAWPCSGWGLPSRAGRPARWWALTPPFHPYRRGEPRRRSVLCCASARSPPPGFHRHPALRSPDFPRTA